MTRAVAVLAVALLSACQMYTVPAGRVSGIVVTRDGGVPISGAFVDLVLSVPVGVEGSSTEPLGTARSRDDGTYEIDFPETRVLVNVGEKPFFAMSVLHPRWQAVGTWFDDLDRPSVRLPLAPQPPGLDPVVEDCRELCGSRDPSQCRDISEAYFGSEDVCAFRY